MGDLGQFRKHSFRLDRWGVLIFAPNTRFLGVYIWDGRLPFSPPAGLLQLS